VNFVRFLNFLSFCILWVLFVLCMLECLHVHFRVCSHSLRHFWFALCCLASMAGSTPGGLW
jgi:hypothetical protein